MQLSDCNPDTALLYSVRQMYTFISLQLHTCSSINNLYYYVTYTVPWLRHYGRSRKVTGSIPDDVIRFFFFIYLILTAALWPCDLLSLEQN
jgi:hypothetical protein